MSVNQPEWPDKQSFSWKDIERIVDTALGKRTIAFHRVFADLAGGALPGLFLSQVYFYSRQPGTIANDGWFYKSREQWEEETALTRAEQETARKQLKGRELLEEKMEGLPRRLYYRLHAENFYRALVKAALPDGDKITDLPGKQTREGKPDRRAGNKIARKQGAKSPALVKEDVPTDVQEKQQQTVEAAPVVAVDGKPYPDDSLTAALIIGGMARKQAQECAGLPELARAWMNYSKTQTGIKNVSAFVLSGVRSGDYPPGYTDPATAARQAEEQQAKQKVKQQDIAAYLLNEYKKLPPHEQSKVNTIAECMNNEGKGTFEECRRKEMARLLKIAYP